MSCNSSKTKISHVGYVSWQKLAVLIFACIELKQGSTMYTDVRSILVYLYRTMTAFLHPWILMSSQPTVVCDGKLVPTGWWPGMSERAPIFHIIYCTILYMNHLLHIFAYIICIYTHIYIHTWYKYIYVIYVVAWHRTDGRVLSCTFFTFELSHDGFSDRLTLFAMKVLRKCLKVLRDGLLR